MTLQFDDEGHLIIKPYTAWEVCAEDAWQWEGYVISTGRQTYDMSGVTRNCDGCWLGRVEDTGDYDPDGPLLASLRMIKRYVKPDMIVNLVKG